MTLQVIPTDGQVPWYRQTTSISGTRYTLEFRYNTRMGGWCLDVLNAAAQPIVLGVPLLIERPLLNQYAASAVPPGVMMVLDTSGNEAQPVLGSFLIDHVLYYLTAS